MRTMFLIAHILVQLSAATPVVAQLPPEVLADSYLLEVEQAFRDGDHNRARAKIREILDLQAEHELNLPELEFWKAKAADSMDSPDQVFEFVLRYLTMAGREGRHYVDALELMNTVQAIVRCKGWETEEYFQKATPEEVSSCLDTGVAVETRDESGRTPLIHSAAHTENPIVVESLIRYGADLEAQDAEGHTPLVVAVVHNEDPRVIEILLNAGASLKKLEPVLQTSATDLKKLEQVLESVLNHMAPNEGEAQFRSKMLALMNRVRVAAGTVFAEGVISSQSPAESTTRAPGVAPAGNVGASTGGGQCEIPGYPRPANVQNLGLSWCPATVNFQARVFALQAAGAQCAIATGSSSTPEQIQARRQEIQVACERLAALGVSNCQCP